MSDTTKTGSDRKGYTYAEAAALIGAGKTTIAEAVRTGELRATPFGPKKTGRIIRVEEFDRWLDWLDEQARDH